MRLVVILSLLLSFVTIKADENVLDKYNSAITSYENKDFSTSLSLFLEIEETVEADADLYYNIGNSYFRLNQLGKAILYYKRCLRLDPLHKYADQNLKLAFSLRKDKQTESEDYFISETFEKLYKALPLNLLAISVIVTFIIMIVIINVIILKYRYRDKTHPVFFLIIIITILLLLSILSYIKWKDFHYSSEAVLIGDTAISYSGPGEDYTRLFTIHEGMVFIIEKENEEWIQIKLENGLGGWIKNTLAERVH
ncbi:MAG: tetratricopeptide repeat protein [Candidatus Cloacimonetes bacterium]|nr:tetratricopeptide repeat protein [Candidatus Cloacimonadota bacterium]